MPRSTTARPGSLALTALVAVLVGCAEKPATVRVNSDSGFALTELAPVLIEVPGGNRPEGATLEARIPLVDGWTRETGEKAARRFRRPLPVRPRTLLTDRAPKGLRLLDAEGRPLPHESQAGPQTSRWGFGESHVTVLLTDPGLDPAELVLEDVRAPAREARLNRALSAARGDLEFVRASFFDRRVTRSGLLVPAPGRIAFELELPRDPWLHFAPCLVPPEIGEGPASDGVTMSVTLREAPGSASTLWSAKVSDAGCPAVALDLGAWAGERVTLELASEPGATATYDYAFFADPVVATAKADAKRVVLLFVDTLRPDHLGLYGYERETSPRLDALAKRALVFENARAPAPWTLPSTRALLTGRHPDRFAVSPTLPRAFRDRGWATAFFGGNAFVSASFGLDRGWGFHRADHDLSAEEMVDRGLAWLDEQRGRDALLVLHFMDPHLPYEEPQSHRRLFAGDAPASLGESFDRWSVSAAGPLTEAEKDYVRNRYDNNVRYVDDQIGRLLDRLGEQDVVVFFSDHGEEFWEHGGFEHGHSLHDELLRVPLVVRAPGLEPGRVEAPVSLLDVMPTLLDLFDMPVPPMKGRSLLDSRAGEAAAGRALAFGWPLYGAVRWGALRDGQKYLTHLGEEALYDLEEDPGETTNLLEGRGWMDAAPQRALLAEALGRDVRLGFVAAAQARAPSEAQLVDLRLQVPGAFETTWSRAGYLHPPGARVETSIREGVAYARWAGWFEQGPAVYVLPSGEFEAACEGLEVSARWGGRVGPLRVERSPEIAAGRLRRPLAFADFPDGLRVIVSPVVTPLPLDPEDEGARYDAESESALRSLGYTGGGS